jgi:hypothetical protein
MSDNSLESNPNRIGERAMCVIRDIRDIDPDETVGTLTDRAVAITEARCVA